MSIKSSLWLGIDLGTYNSSAAIKIRNDIVIINEVSYKSKNILNFLSHPAEKLKAYPSFFYFDKEGNILDIGEKAKEKAYSYPQFVVWGIKRLIGKQYNDIKEKGELARYPFSIKPDRNNGQCVIAIGDKRYTPVQMCTEIFKKIKKDAENQIREKVNSVVVSVPAYFDPGRVTPIIEAAREAGFVNIKTIPEPVAAALAFKIDITVKPIKTLVFDLGAGTLDVTTGLIYRHPNVPGEFLFQVVKNTGDSRLGGIDMDDRIVELIKYKCELNDLPALDLAAVRRLAEVSKIKLSEEHKADGEIVINGKNYQFSINKYDLVAAFEGSGPEKNLLDACRLQVRAALNESNWNSDEIDLLLMIGGPTKLPCIQEIMKIIFKTNFKVMRQLEDFKSGYEKVDRMNAVSIGAAISIDRNVDDKVPYGHGIEDFKIGEKTIIIKPNILIPRDASYPYKTKPCMLDWCNQTGFYEFKIIQHVPKSEINQYGYEFRFIGVIKFVVSNPNMCLILIQMGYNSNKELEVIVRNAFSDESVSYVGLNNNAPVGMKYPMEILKPPDMGQKIVKLPPEDEDIIKFSAWINITLGFFTRKIDSSWIKHQDLSDQIDVIVNFQRDLKSKIEQTINVLNQLNSNSKTKGVISQNESVDIDKHISDFKDKLIRYKIVN